jgi:hypothetical protein
MSILLVFMGAYFTKKSPYLLAARPNTKQKSLPTQRKMPQIAKFTSKIIYYPQTGQTAPLLSVTYLRIS